MTIISLMKELSYPTNEGGVCHGLAFMAERARMYNQYDKFLERINYLHSLNANEIQGLLSEAKKHSIEKLPLTNEEEILLTVDAFFYQIWAHYNPGHIHQYLSVNEGPMWNAMEVDKLESFLFEHSEISPLPKPKTHFISGSLGTGGYSSLNDYLETVKNSDISCGLIFGSPIHTIHAFYDKEKNRWFLTNHSTLTDYESSESLAQAILSAFTALIPPGESAEFINLYASVFTNETAEKTNDFFQNLSAVSSKDLTSRIENKTAANPSSSGTSLMIAAMAGNLNTLRALLAIVPKIDINYMNPRGRTALLTAIQYNRLEMIQELLNYPIEVNNGFPLHLALMYKNSDIAKELLRHTDIDVNILDSKNVSPLLLAIRQKQFDIAHLLLENPRVDVNAQDKNSVSPLIEAIRQGHLETVKLLLGKKETQIDWALHEAARSGNSEIVKTLLADLRVMENLVRTRAQQTKAINPLCDAVQQGNVDVVKILVNDPLINVNGGNPLLTAIEKGNLEIVQILLKNPNIKVNQVNENGRCPLRVAIEMAKNQGGARQDAIVEELLNHRLIDLDLLNEEDEDENDIIKKSCTYQPVINFINNMLNVLNDKKTDNNVAEIIENWEWILSGLKDDLEYAAITHMEERRVNLFDGISANLDACKDYLQLNDSNNSFFNSNPNSFAQLKKELSNIERKVIERGSRLSPAESLKLS